MVKSICRMSGLVTFISLRPKRRIASFRCAASVLFFFLMKHSLKAAILPVALGLEIWYAKFLASARLTIACCYCFHSHNSRDRNVGSLPMQFYTFAVCRWCFLSGCCVMQPYSPNCIAWSRVCKMHKTSLPFLNQYLLWGMSMRQT